MCDACNWKPAHCYVERMPWGGPAIMCGDLGEYCAADGCMASTDFLCDYPVGDGRTCDLPLCRSHAYQVGDDVHYCPNHFLLHIHLSRNDTMRVVK